jgi:tetratricopeptide (TPR) repeat protein
MLSLQVKSFAGFVFIIIAVITAQENLFALTGTEQYYDLREKEIYRFCFDLFETGEYYRAITEAKRYISLFPQGKNLEEVQKLIGDSYLLSREWPRAVQAYDEFIARFPNSPYANRVLFNKAICLVKKGNYIEAERMFQEIIDRSDTQKYRESLLWKILLLIQENKFEEIQELLDDEFVKQQIGKKIGIIEHTISVKQNISYKSPRLAGVMSVILPGSGQFYNTRYRDGVYSFILNALFIWGAVKAFDDDNPAVGGILTIFEAGWYSGNVYGAVSGAHKYNRKIDEDIFNKSLENFELLEYEIRKTHDVSIMFRFYF